MQRICVIAGLWLGLTFGRGAAADTYRVPDDYATIQRAITLVDEGDVILVAPGVYLETLHITRDGITLRSMAGPESTIIDAEGDELSVIRCTTGTTVIIEGFTITGGLGTPYSTAGSWRGGGGILIDGSMPIFRDCIIEGNDTYIGGGALLFNGSDASFERCVFDDNYANDGSGICLLDGALNLVDCTFTNNGSGETGGGLLLDDGTTTVIEQCHFEDNGALVGGAIFVDDCTVSINQSVFVHNRASLDGGAIYMYEGEPQLTATNCIFIRNIAVDEGGVVYHIRRVDGITNFINCTFANNHATTAGAIEGHDSVRVENCIIWQNMPYDVTGNESTITHSCVGGGYPGEGNIDVDPMFITSFVLSPGHVHLRTGSPCIDAGDSTALADEVHGDAFGVPRFLDDPDTADTGIGFPCVDMGAVEFYPIINQCPWDTTGPLPDEEDGTVGVEDFFNLLQHWGPCAEPVACPGDTSGSEGEPDGTVGVEDFYDLLQHWGPCP
jgi:hypothetical protein